MPRHEGRTLRKLRGAALAGAVAILAAFPATAGAAFTTPTAFDFGGVPVGTTSAPQNVTLTADCPDVVDLFPLPPVCPGALTTDLVNVSPGTTGDFGFNNLTCGTGIGPAADGTPQSCTISVTFTPATAGPGAGILTVGTIGPGGIVPGPTVGLSGTGLVSYTSSPIEGGAGTPGAPKPRAKKCRKKNKKKHSAQSAKKRKCKKRKRKR